MKSKKFILIMIAILTLTMAFGTTTFASNLPVEIQIRPFSEADYIIDINEEVGFAYFVAEPTVQAFAYNTKTYYGSGYFYLKSDNSVLGNIKTTGTFNYNGSLCNVTSVSNSVSNTADGWKIDNTKDSEQISATNCVAIGEFKLYKVGLLGSTTLSSAAVIRVYCNQNGTTTSEFNGS